MTRPAFAAGIGPTCPMKPRRDTPMPQRPPGLDPIVAEIIEALADCIIWREDCRARSKEHPTTDSKE
jgi:hypothetical protein